MQETQETLVFSLGRKDTLAEDMETHSSILAWKVPRTEDPGRQQTMGSSQRGGRDQATTTTNVIDTVVKVMRNIILC